MSSQRLSPQEVGEVVTRLVRSYEETGVMDDIERTHLPSHQSVVDIIRRIRSVVFPVHLERESVSRDTIGGILHEELAVIVNRLTEQVARCFAYQTGPAVTMSEHRQRAAAIVRDFTLFLPELRQLAREDVVAAQRGDPAAYSHDQIAIAYPTITALLVHRLAHFLSLAGVPMLPRIMSERAHTVTGIDINPGAKIGRFCFIDHGTGVVIGETAEIGENVKIYQGVTLGALSLDTNAAGKVTTTGKRHPTVEDNVTIYANATILGGKTVIGKNSIIGGNVWITSSVPPNSRVAYDAPGKASVRIAELDPADRRPLAGEYSI